ncbi:hypothetical protein Hanom_Chr10g00932561 [Helianthus anomalus]
MDPNPNFATNGPSNRGLRRIDGRRLRVSGQLWPMRGHRRNICTQHQRKPFVD